MLSLLIVLGGLFSGHSFAGQTLINNGVICADNHPICIKGSLRINDAKGLALLKGRVVKTTEPGFLRISLRGFTGDQRVFDAFIQGRLQGKYSEIVDLKNSASRHSDTVWQIISVDYRAFTD